MNRFLTAACVFASGAAFAFPNGAAAAESPITDALRVPPAPPVPVFRERASSAPRLIKAAATVYSIGDPTPEEQLYLELINRARANPVAESHILAASTDPHVLSAYSDAGVDLSLMIAQFATNLPAPPLAMNAQLIDSAREHSLDMFQNVFQEHNGSDGSTFDQRISAAGYNFFAVSENVFAYAYSVFYGHAGFEVDWGAGPGGMQNPAGHRRNIHSTRYREVGIGVVNGTNGIPSSPEIHPVGPQLVTQDFGVQQKDTPFITGVAYYDLNGNSFYDIGEGIGGVAVSIAGYPTQAVTARSGGYALPVPTNGLYEVTFSGPGFPDLTQQVTISNRNNVKLDFTPPYSAPQVLGDSAPATGRTNVYAISPVGGATEYQVRIFKLENSQSEGAENGTNRITINQSPGYDVIQSGVTNSGAFAFHLATPDSAFSASDASQYITLNSTYLPGTNGSISFASRLGFATTNQHAQVQISTNNGGSWTPIFDQAGNEGKQERAFTNRTVSLSGFAGELIQIRFVYVFNTGKGIVNFDGGVDDGWIFDDIEFSDVQESSSEQLQTIATNDFEFLPPGDGTYILQTRAQTGHDFLDWGPMFSTAAVPPSGTPDFSISEIARVYGTLQISVFLAGGANPASWTVEARDGMGQAWAETAAEMHDLGHQQYRFDLPEPAATVRFYRVRAN